MAKTKAKKADKVISSTPANTELEATLKINEELVAEIEDLKQHQPPPTPTVVSAKGLSFTHNKVQYGFNFPRINLGGKNITAEEICTDEALQAKLVAIKSGMIKPLK